MQTDRRIREYHIVEDKSIALCKPVSDSVMHYWETCLGLPYSSRFVARLCVCFYGETSLSLLAETLPGTRKLDLQAHRDIWTTLQKLEELQGKVVRWRDVQLRVATQQQLSVALQASP